MKIIADTRNLQFSFLKKSKFENSLLNLIKNPKENQWTVLGGQHFVKIPHPTICPYIV